ncbi:MAG: Holliday junction ATP-dependent DNA helicase RuvA [Phycisphaerae bacterium]|nr:Holliday junction ATP-dependent DNA helicase RuvA [Phycisphaerae bacterium]
MIVKMTGVLSELSEHALVLERQGIAREIMIPACALGELAAQRGREVTLYTQEYLEGSAGNSPLVPRMIGFVRPEDRAFFRRFTEVKGIGPRKALKALAEPVHKIAWWIQQGDKNALSRLPGIGSRAAELIIAELKGKVEEFIAGSPPVATADLGQWSQAQRDALEILVAWGDSRSDAERLLERASHGQEQLHSADEWVRAAYKIRQGAEV